MEIEISQKDNFIIIGVSGEVDLFYSSQLREEISNQLNQGNNVAVDLANVSYIDSSGVASLVEGLQSSKKINLHFTLIATSKAVMQVLQLARLDRVIPHVNTTEELQA